MTKAEVLQALKQMNTEDRLEIIEVASRLIREELAVKPRVKVEQLTLAAAVEVMRPYYEKVSELAIFTDQDTEDFSEYEEYA